MQELEGKHGADLTSYKRMATALKFLVAPKDPAVIHAPTGVEAPAQLPPPNLGSRLVVALDVGGWLTALEPIQRAAVLQTLTAAKEHVAFGFYSCSLVGGQVGGQDMVALGELATQVTMNC